MTDANLALLVAIVLAVLFIIVALVRRTVSPVAAASPDPHRVDRIDERLKDLEGDLKTTKHDVGNIKMIVANLPNKDATHRMELDLKTLDGKVIALQTELAATSRSCERIEQILMARDSK